MDILLGTVNGEKENASFYMNGNTLIFGTYDKRSTIPDSSIKELNGKYYADLDFLKFDSEFKHIEIPESVLNACDRIRKENELIQNTAGSIETSQGKVYFSIDGSDYIIAKVGEKAVKTDRIFDIEGKKALFVPDLDLDFPFLELPAEVEIEFKKAKKEKAMASLCLVYVGRSLLTGKDYYDFNVDVPQQTWGRVKILFENFGESVEDRCLKGWLTSSPGLVKEYLRIRNPIESRKSEIEKGKAKAVKANSEFIKILS
jgi:hypothetical protein